MANVNRFLLECTLKIRNLDEFAAFREYLKQEEKAAMKVLAGSRDDRMMYNAQGSYQTLIAIQELIEQSPGLLDKERQRQAGK